MDALIDEAEHELVVSQPDREATFADAVAEWRAWAEHTKRLKPATLRNYDALLSRARRAPRGGGERLARIMRAFGDRRSLRSPPPRSSVSFAGSTARASPGRSVNSHRQALANVFEYATRADASRSRPSGPRRRQTPRGLLQAARDLHRRAGPWRSRGRRGRGTTSTADAAGRAAEEDLEQQRANAQDAAIYIVAGFTGLRQGELRALRWQHVRFADRTLVVVAAHVRRRRVAHQVRQVARRPAHARGVRRARRAQPARVVHRAR